MRLKSLKGFTLNRSGDKSADRKTEKQEEKTPAPARMEDQMSSRTRELEAMAQKLQGLSAKKDRPAPAEDTVEEPPVVEEKLEEKEDEEEIIVKPHGPIEELTVAPDEEDPDDELDLEMKEGAEMAPETVSLGEAKPEAPETVELIAGEEEDSEEEDSDSKKDDDGFNNLFSSDEDEENPLANLIKSLPDVTAQELLDDLDDIKGIISDWQHN